MAVPLLSKLEAAELPGIPIVAAQGIGAKARERARHDIGAALETQRKNGKLRDEAAPGIAVIWRAFRGSYSLAPASSSRRRRDRKKTSNCRRPAALPRTRRGTNDRGRAPATTTSAPNRSARFPGFRRGPSGPRTRPRYTSGCARRRRPLAVSRRSGRPRGTVAPVAGDREIDTDVLRAQNGRGGTGVVRREMSRRR